MTRQIPLMRALRPTRKLTLAVLMSLLWTTGAYSGAYGADLMVSVIGLKTNKGDVHIALYDSPELFPDSEGMRSEEEVLVSGKQASVVFRDLKPGRYAIAVYHDENGNHDFDQGFLGIPLEDFGFSNGARAFLAPPSFEEAYFELSMTGATTVIDLDN